MNFKRGQSPHKTLSIGKYKPYEIGDKIISLNDLYWSTDWEISTNNTRVNIAKNQIGEIRRIDVGCIDALFGETKVKWIKWSFSENDLAKYFQKI